MLKIKTVIALCLGMAVFAVHGPASGQESLFSKENFDTEFKSIERVEQPPAKSDEDKADDGTEEEKSESPPTQEELAENLQEELYAELKEQLTGAWAFVTLINKPLTNAALQEGARRCVAPMQLKNLQFENTAKKTLPDINGLYGDVVYFPTEAGLQRLDIETGKVLLVTQIAKQQQGPNKIIWGIRGQQFGLRLRFSKQNDQSDKPRFLLEEGRMLLRCPLKGDPFDTGE